MTQLHPITGAVIGSAAAQRVQADDKAAQLRKAEQKRNNTPSGDSYERQVHSPEELTPIGDEANRQSPQKRPRKKQGADEPDPSIDIKA